MKEGLKTAVLALSTAALLSQEVLAEQPVAPQISAIQSGTRIQIAMATQTGDPLMALVSAKETQNRQKIQTALQSNDSFSSAYSRIQGMIENLPSPLREEKKRIAALSVRIEQLAQQKKVAETYPGWFLLDIQTWSTLGISATDLKQQLSRWENNFLPKS